MSDWVAICQPFTGNHSAEKEIIDSPSALFQDFERLAHMVPDGIDGDVEPPGNLLISQSVTFAEQEGFATTGGKGIDGSPQTSLDERTFLTLFVGKGLLQIKGTQVSESQPGAPGIQATVPHHGIHIRLHVFNGSPVRLHADPQVDEAILDYIFDLFRVA